MIHNLADVSPNCEIGTNTRVWQFSIIFEGAVIGSDCNVCAHTLIESDVVVGNSVTIKSGVFLWDGLRVGNFVFIGPNVTFTNDKHPKSKVYKEGFLQTVIDDNVSIGANATILPGIKIGKGAVIGAGAIVTKNVSPGALVMGNAARHINKKDLA